MERHAIIFNAGSGSGAGTDWRFRDRGRELVVKLNPRLAVNEIDAILMAATAGHGIARPLSYHVAEQLEAGTLVHLLPAYEPLPLPVQLLLPSARHMPPRLRAGFELLANALSALAVLSAK